MSVLISDDPHLLGLRTLGALADLELHPLAVFEAAVPIHLDGGVVNEEVISAVYGDEAVALLGVEPLHGALSHSFSLCRGVVGPRHLPGARVVLAPPTPSPVSEGLACLVPRSRHPDRGRPYTLIQYPQQMHRSARNGRTRGRGPVSKALGFLGELLLTAGVLVLLYVAYVLWGTGIQTERAQDDMREQIEAVWEAPQEEDASVEEQDASVEVDDTTGLDGVFGIIRMPRLGDDWEWIVVDDVDLGSLARGPGHYPDSANPGELGNLAIAGHRSGHGAPFHNLDELQVGDTIEIQTADGTWTYTVDAGPTIIEPTDVWVIDPVPGSGVEAEPNERRITLTTCHPRYGSTQRMYVSGVLTSGEEV